ncbi:hypothetical protein SteCoe_37106 [Stentor coeruleus]|uniref:XLF-like N-terminal domain-containing protein n=1 Tax=Stentor coeruleus TaxID=5963 RepID=A0A1R2ANN7_9CILI|nr:hypothetical protein SteCoe_37106 [Stentor coeruleus]
MVKGQAIVGETSSYSLLMTDFVNVYYSSAGTTQIIKEIAEYNPMVQGGLAGLIPILNSCISEFNSETRYVVNLDGPSNLEIQRTMNNIYSFKWVFYLTKLSSEVGKKVIQNLMVFPLLNTVLAQDHAIKGAEESMKKPLVLDSRYGGNKDLNIKISDKSRNLLNEGFSSFIKEEEVKMQRQNELKRREEEEKRAKQAAELKRRQDVYNLPEKKPKTSIVENYQESEAEAKRRRELENKLNKKKDKKKLDFL